MARRKSNKAERERRRHQTEVADERGWAGQRGQRPANDEEKNYHPDGRHDSNFAKSN